MKKTTIILFLGVTLAAFNVSAKETKKFDNFFAPDGNIPQKEMIHPIMEDDDNFLSEIEGMQKNITVMQLELKEKELEYRVKEQDRKMEGLGRVEETMIPVSKGSSSQSLDMFIPPVSAVDNRLYVTSIKGIENSLKATVGSEELGIAVVGVGDVLNNGSKVVNISQNTVTLEDASGDVEIVGLSSSRR